MKPPLTPTQRASLRTWINWLFVIGCVAFYFLYLIVWSSPFPLATSMQPRYFGVGWRCLCTPLFWVLVFLTVCTCVAIDVVYDRLRVLLRPTPHDHARALESRAVCCRSRVRASRRKGLCASLRACGARKEQLAMLEVTSVNGSGEAKREEEQPQNEDEVRSYECTDTYILVNILMWIRNLNTYIHTHAHAHTHTHTQTPHGQSRIPKDFKILQQTLPGCHPLGTINVVTVGLLVIGVCLISLGLLIQVEKNRLHTLTATYSGGAHALGVEAQIFGSGLSRPRPVAHVNCSHTRPLRRHTPNATRHTKPPPRTCTVTFHVKQPLKPPLGVFYQVDNMHQNNLVYSTSASFPQLRGEERGKQALRIRCGSDYLVAPADTLYWPCGLMANTMFTDRFELVSPRGVRMRDSGISWSTDADYVFRNPKGWRPYSNGSTPGFLPGYTFIDQAYADTPLREEFRAKGVRNEVGARMPWCVVIVVCVVIVDCGDCGVW